MRILALALAGFVWSAAAISDTAAERPFFVLQATTTTQNSGLLDALLPKFEAASGIDVRVVVFGTGQALRNGENGDVDLLLVHAPQMEAEFVKNGFGVERHHVMENDFVLVGPEDDLAGTRDASGIADALERIASVKALFISRGDNSGTHIKETEIWRMAGVDPRTGSGEWYLEAGGGMGATLNISAARGAYTIADRASWASFANRAGLALLFEDDDELLRNPYGLVLVNPDRHAHVKAAEGQAFIDWMTGKEGQAGIAAFTIDGQPVFFPASDPARHRKD